MKTLLVIMELFWFVATCVASYCNPVDRDSLLSFSGNMTIGSARLDWNISADCCTWEGVDCDIYGRVKRLNLPSRGLVGSISPSVANLSHLSELNLRQNLLTGTFPAGFFVSMSHLQIIDLSYNRLSGEFPSSDMLPATTEFADFSSNNFHGTIPPGFLNQAINLVSFNISNNSFNGLIPCFICSISPSIVALDFSYNQFSGSIPRDARNCTMLQSLRAGFNSLSGPLPQEIYGLSTLQELFFPSNKLNGSLTSDVSRLKNLRILALYANEFTGMIPPEIGQLSNLEELLLHVNRLSGTLPPALTNCTRLTELILRVNLLSGDISKFDFSKFAQLRMIDLGNNFFSGSLSTLSLFTCKSLTAIRLATNQLTGEIPPTIQALQSLSFLSISNNSLTNVTGAIRILSYCTTLGTIFLSKNFYDESFPGDQDYRLFDSRGFQKLQVLGLGGCLLNGRIPRWLVKLPKLKALDLSFNSLTGSIPSFFQSLPNLFYLDLSENNLSGNIPVELTGMPGLARQQPVNQVDITYLEFPVFVTPGNVFSLQYNQLSDLPPAIYLKSNNLSGNIPVEIGRLKFIRVLDISENHFSGGIPRTISDLSNLEKLDLSDNHLSGEIPALLGNLHFLYSFDVANNNLEGPLPTGGQFDTFPESSFEGNPGLCGIILQQQCHHGGQSAASDHQNPSAKRKISKEKIIFGLYVGVCYGVGFAISTIAMQNYEIEGSFLHGILKKLIKMRMRVRPF